jgi:acyl transferase domain-containing protein
LGHLLAAAGVSGLIKALVALKHRMLPPTINFATLNDHIILADSPFYLNTELRPWPGAARRAAVSTFGSSGTNAHLLIEAFAPETETACDRMAPDQPRLLLFSA